MGSWSESCGFSGLEIGEGDVAYICLTGTPKFPGGHGAFSEIEPKTTLIRGHYNDYGYLRIEDDDAVLAIFNEQSGLDLKQGDDFSLDHLNGRPEVDRWWINGHAFDFIAQIKPDFPYIWLGQKSTKFKTIGEGTDLRFDDVRAALVELKADLDKVNAETTDEEMKALRLAMAMGRVKLNERLGGYRETHGFDREKAFEDVQAGRDYEGRITAWRRVWMLEYGLMELRSRLRRSEGVGPQHGGHIALKQFGQFLVKACNAELKGRD